MYAPVGKAAPFVSYLRLAPFLWSGLRRNTALPFRAVWSRTSMYAPVGKAAPFVSYLRLAPFLWSELRRNTALLFRADKYLCHK